MSVSPLSPPSYSSLRSLSVDSKEVRALSSFLFRSIFLIKFLILKFAQIWTLFLSHSWSIWRRDWKFSELTSFSLSLSQIFWIPRSGGFRDFSKIQFQLIAFLSPSLAFSSPKVWVGFYKFSSDDSYSSLILSMHCGFQNFVIPNSFSPSALAFTLSLALNFSTSLGARVNFVKDVLIFLSFSPSEFVQKGLQSSLLVFPPFPSIFLSNFSECRGEGQLWNLSKFKPFFLQFFKVPRFGVDSKNFQATNLPRFYRCFMHWKK